MRPATYEIEAAVNRTHWWFAGRRRLFERLIVSLAPDPAWRVLDVGTGTGANLPVFHRLGLSRVVGCDLMADAFQDAASAHRTWLVRGDACHLPFQSGSFDLIVAADVIEHLEHDDAALREFMRLLRPDGHLLITVPAFPALWGPQDVVAHHRRRYRRAPLLTLLRSAGVYVSTCFYFNYLLFAPIWLARKLLLAARVHVDSENQINTRLTNTLFSLVFFADVASAPVLKPPFGVSLCAIGQKRAGS